MISLSPISNEGLQEFYADFPEEICTGIPCEKCPCGGTAKELAIEEEGISQEASYEKYACPKAPKYLLPEMYRRSLITKEQMLDGLSEVEP